MKSNDSVTAHVKKVHLDIIESYDYVILAATLFSKIFFVKLLHEP